MIKQISNKDKKKQITKSILEELSNWFEDETGRNNYINNCVNNPMFVHLTNNKPDGFLTLKKASKHTVELWVMGVTLANQKQGIGSALITHATQWAKENGYLFMQVKTVKMGVYPEYDITNKFYIKNGFKELECIEEIWGKENPCMIYIKNL